MRLLAPAALPSTTICVGEVAIVSTAAGLLESTRVIGCCTLITMDLPTSTCTVSPSAGSLAGCCGGALLAWGWAGAAGGFAWAASCPARASELINRTRNILLLKLDLIICSPAPVERDQIYALYARFLE